VRGVSVCGVLGQRRRALNLELTISNQPFNLKVGDIVRAKVKSNPHFGLFFEYESHEILVTIISISWIPSFAHCAEVAAIGDVLEIKITGIDLVRNKIGGSIQALHPENNPWDGSWQLNLGDVMEATVVRYVEKANRCGYSGGYLLQLRPAALVMFCDPRADLFERGDKCMVRITSVDPRRRKVTVGLVS
jgi:ribosomal protein S1